MHYNPSWVSHTYELKILEIKVGHVYKTRKGDLVKITHIDEDKTGYLKYPVNGRFVDKDGNETGAVLSATLAGRYVEGFGTHDNDIVEEYKDLSVNSKERFCSHDWQKVHMIYSHFYKCTKCGKDKD